MAGRGDEALLRADVPAIHVFFAVTSQDVDHRDKPGDDDFSGSVLSLMSTGPHGRDIGAKQSFVASRSHDEETDTGSDRGAYVRTAPSQFVMAGLVPAIHVLLLSRQERGCPGHWREAKLHRLARA